VFPESQIKMKIGIRGKKEEVEGKEKGGESIKYFMRERGGGDLSR